MINCADIITSMNIRQAILAQQVNRTLREITRNTVDLQAIHPSPSTTFDPVLNNASAGISKIWKNCLERAITDTKMKDLIGIKMMNSTITDIIDSKHLDGIWGYLNRNNTPKDISLDDIKRKLRQDLKFLATNIVRCSNSTNFFKESIINPSNGNVKSLKSISSKEIRSHLTNHDPCVITKLGLLLNTTEAKVFWDKLNKIRNTKTKNDLLRLIHGDIRTNDRLCRQGRVDSPYCDHCGLFDDLDHKLFECSRMTKFWEIIKQTTPIKVMESISETIREAILDQVKITFLTQCVHYSTVSEIKPELIPKIIIRNTAFHHSQIREWQLYLENTEQE